MNICMTYYVLANDEGLLVSAFRTMAVTILSL